MTAEPIALVDARLVDGTGAAPLTGATVAVGDRLSVDDDPLADITVMTDQAAIALVVKEGVVEADRRQERHQAR